MSQVIVAPVARRLKWDSETFGFDVVRIEGITHPSTQLAEIVRKFRREPVQLAYWDWPSADSTGRTAAISLGGALINTRAVLTADALAGCPSDTTNIIVTPSIPQLEMLEALALASGGRSRFALDPHFPKERFEKLYRCWMANSLDGSFADAVIVAPDDDTISGMITVSATDRHGKIGLFAVAPEARGKGIGRQLLNKALGWCSVHHCAKVSVVTQGDNVAALALYRAAGFHLNECYDVFHFWNPA